MWCRGVAQAVLRSRRDVQRLGLLPHRFTRQRGKEGRGEGRREERGEYRENGLRGPVGRLIDGCLLGRFVELPRVVELYDHIDGLHVVLACGQPFDERLSGTYRPRVGVTSIGVVSAQSASARVRALLRRRRRAVAAAAAALAVVFTLLSLRTPPPPPTSPQPTLDAGYVAVPVLIDSPAIASTVAPGDIIDVFAVGDDGRGSLLVADARVLDRPVGATGPDAVLVIAVRESAGRAVATATGRLGFVIRQRGA